MEWLKECRRLRRNISFVRKMTDDWLVAGVDEVGRGPLAGPVVAAAVILPPGLIMGGLDDSKRITCERRRQLYSQVCSRAIAIGTGWQSASDIDDKGIKSATFQAMRTAVLRLLVSPRMVMVDGRDEIPSLGFPQRSIIRGDSRLNCVAAASIVAKVVRDRFMHARHHLFPQYDFASNKGYGTQKHREALRSFGPCNLHRCSFLPSRVQQLSLFKTKKENGGPQ